MPIDQRSKKNPMQDDDCSEPQDVQTGCMPMKKKKKRSDDTDRCPQDQRNRAMMQHGSPLPLDSKFAGVPTTTERCEAVKKHHHGKLGCCTEPTPTPNCRSTEGQECPSCRSQNQSTKLPRPPARPRSTAEDPVKPKQPTGIPATVVLD